MSKLTFIVPVYEPNLVLFEKVLKALVEQSLKEWDAVFVLDGPCPEADSTIARAFKKAPNHYRVIEIAHAGAQAARNEGFKATRSNPKTGAYVVFWDSDCVIEPHAARAWVDILDAQPAVGFVYSGYKFLDEKGAINSEPFDPWLLKVRNYISTCFPMRRELFPGFNEELESLHDWDMWLRVVERGAVGKFLPGYAFSTAYPTAKSISGKGCTSEKWLERMDKVRYLNKLPFRDTCLTSLHDRLDAIALAKAMAADYDDRPNDKPNHYKTIIQLGFSVHPGEFEKCASVWGKEHRKVIFWAAEDVEAIYDTVSIRALQEYSMRLNAVAKQYVEDKAAEKIMTTAGFSVEVMPLPTISKQEAMPLPEKPKFLVDISSNYGHAFMAIGKSIPDIKLEVIGGIQKIEDYTGLVCFHQDRMLRPAVKRMLAAGRHVISNIQAPFTGYLNDRISDAEFMRYFVSKIRSMVKKSPREDAVKFYTDAKRLDRVMEAVHAS